VKSYEGDIERRSILLYRSDAVRQSMGWPGSSDGLSCMRPAEAAHNA
jgi:hypothetical protein